MQNRVIKKVLRLTGIAALRNWLNASSDKKKFDQQFESINQHVVKVGGQSVAFSTKDQYSKHWFFPRYYPNMQHEPAATELFKQHIKPTDTVLDIGAHLGYFSCVAASLAHQGNVHCFEMDELCVPLIEQNIELNGFKNVVVNNCGVGSSTTTEEIPDFQKPNPGLSMKGKAKSHKTVQFVSIDEYVTEHNTTPDFIKIDVEGAELQVLLGMKKVLQSSKAKLLIEIHPWHLKKLFNTHYSDVLKLLEEADFKIAHLLEHRKNSWDLREIDSSTVITSNDMLLCYKP